MKTIYTLIAASFLPTLASAQTPAKASQTLALAETVMVIGKKQEVEDHGLAGSVDIIRQEEIAYEHVNDTFELLSKIPGAYVSRFNQGIINTDVAIRGFASDGSTPHAKLLIDGIPSNLHNGYGELDQLFPLGIESIQVYKGTSDPRYGLFNTAGNYSLNSRTDTHSQIEVNLGSYNSKEAQAYWGQQAGKLTHNYFAGYRESEGYRDHTDLEKYALSARWHWQGNKQTDFTAIARASGYDGDAPGYLSKTEATDDPTAAAPYALEDGGNKSTAHLSLHANHAFSEAMELSAKVYAQNFERERWVRFAEQSSLQNRFDDQSQAGLIATLSWQLNEQWSLAWGVDGEHQDITEQRFGTVDNTRQRSEQVSRDFDYTFGHYGSYLKLGHSPNDLLQWNASIRADRLQGDLTSRAADGVESEFDLHDFGTMVQPKLNITLTPIEALVLFANYGRSFQHPFGRGAYLSANVSARDISINDGWESGVNLSVTRDFNIRLSHWRQDAKDEFVLVDGTAQNVGETRREGYDIAAHWTPIEQLLFWGNAASVNSKIIRPDETKSDQIGNELRSIPSFTAAAGVNYQINNAWTARLHMDAQGDYYVNETNSGGKFGRYTLLHISADYQQPQYYVRLQVNNVLDEYYEYVYDFGGAVGAIHSPGNGTNANVSVGVYL